MSAKVDIKVNVDVDKAQANLDAFKGAIDVVGGSVEAVVGGLALLGIENKYIENLEQGALGAIAFADGIGRMSDGVIALSKAQREGAVITKAFTTAQRAFNAVAKTNPIMLIVMALVALMATIPEVRKAFMSIIKGVFEPLSPILEQLGGLIAKLLDMGLKPLMPIIELLTPMLVKIIEVAFIPLQIQMKALAYVMENFIIPAFDLFVKGVENIKEKVLPIFNDIKSSIVSFIDTAKSLGERALKFLGLDGLVVGFGGVNEKVKETTLSLEEQIEVQQRSVALLKARGASAKQIYEEELRLINLQIEKEEDEELRKELIHKKNLLMAGEEKRLKEEQAKKDKEHSDAKKKQDEQALEKAQRKLELENIAVEAGMSARDIELKHLKENHDKMVKEMEELGIDTKDIKEKYRKEVQDINDKYDKEGKDNLEELARLAQDAGLTQQQKELQALDLFYQEKIRMMEENGIDSVAFTEEYEQKKKEVKDKFRDKETEAKQKEIEDDMTLRQQRTQLLVDSLSEFQGLMDVFTQVGMERLDARTSSVEAQYEREIASAGDNEDEVAKITRRRDKELAKIEKERQKRENQALIFQQTIELAKMTASASTALSQIAVDTSKAGSEVSSGFASTMKAGFPANVPLLIAYTAQAGAIMASIIKARRQAKQAINSEVPTAGGGGGGGNAGIPTLSSSNISTPENIDRQNAIFNQQQEPIKAYVVAGDVQDGLEANQQIQSRRTL